MPYQYALAASPTFTFPPTFQQTITLQCQYDTGRNTIKRNNISYGSSNNKTVSVPEIFPGPLPPSSARYAGALNTDCQHLLRPTARQSKGGQKITRLISILRLQKAKPQDTTHLGLSPRCLQPQREFPAANAHAKGGPNQQSLAQNRSFPHPAFFLALCINYAPRHSFRLPACTV